MTKMVMDGAARGVDAGWMRWSDVLDTIDREIAPYGRIVTGVRIDGADHPGFRDSSLLTRPVEGIGSVEVQSGTPVELVGRCVADASGAIGALRASAAAVGAAFRRHDLQPANTGLSELAGGLASLISLLHAVGMALNVDLAAPRDGERSPSDLIAELATHVEALIAAQSNQDWLTVADVVEYDVEPSLKRWHSLFATFAPDAAPAPLRVAV